MTKPGTVAWLYLLVVTLAEALVVFIHPTVGLTVYGLILIALLWHSAHSQQSESLIWNALLPVPLIRLLSLSLPLADFPPIWWYFITSLPLFAAVVAAVRFIGVEWKDLGLRWQKRQIPLQFVVGMGGICLGWIEYQILQPLPLVTEFTFATLWMPVLILLVSTGFLEELIFRGLLLHAATRVWSLQPAVLFVSLLFAVLHIGYYSPVNVLFVFLVGVLFSYIVACTCNIWGIAMAHGLTNVGLYLIFPHL